jgi:phenylalanyl-tRNA synthetase beta chain
MRFSYNWLKELSKTEKSPQELIEMVMLKGFELEEQFDLAEVFKNFVVGKITKIEAHPNADKLRIAWIDLGEFGQEVQIVCGAPNIEVGQNVPVAMPGAILPNSKMEIKKAEMRGVESNGMICAEDEIGLGKDHEGIMILGNDLKPGQSLSQALKLEDIVLDFDILPNRAHDCLSYQGLAREISAMEERGNDFSPQPKAGTAKADLKNTDFLKKGNLLNIEIEDEKLCPRYMGAVLKNIKIKESPDWMKARLVASGMEPINNVVDITNYVMLETGSPLHAFDFDEVAKNNQVNILVRKAKKGEKLELLSDDNLELNEEDLLITNGEKALALAGIKGGKKSGINSETNQIVLEAANFDLLTIRKSRQRHCLATESQARFEKGISPILTQMALNRAVELFKEYAEAEVVEIVDCNKFENQEQVVDFEIEKTEKLLGEKVDKKEIFKTLENLGFEILNKENKIEVKVPYWRLDIEGQVDFIEEIGRIKGYEKIKPEHLMTAVKPSKRNSQRELEWKIKDNLTALSFDEIITYSFYGQQEVETGKIVGDHLELENPNNEQQKLVRRTLIPGIIEANKTNQKNFGDFCLFEIGRIYFPEKENLEEIRISGSCFNENLKSEEVFYQTKGKIKTLLQKITGQRAEFKTFNDGDNNFYHLTRKAEISIKNKVVGYFGEINPLVLNNYRIKKSFIIFELDFDMINKIKKEKKNFQTIQKFPFVDRDLAMFVDKKTEANEVEKIIQKAGGKTLKELELFDIFENQEGGKKSLAFHLKFGKDNETLKGKEVDERVEEIIKTLEENEFEVRK